MDWSDVILLVLVVAILVLYIRLMRKNLRLRQMADEANRLRCEAEAAWQRNRQLKQEMTSNIAHELKTPVSSIRGYLEILLGDKPVDDERRRHYLQRSYSQTLRLSDLIQDVSIINKLEESADLFPRTAVDANGVVAEAISDFTDKAVLHSITIYNNLPSMPLTGNHELLYSIVRFIDNFYVQPGRRIVFHVVEYFERRMHFHY